MNHLKGGTKGANTEILGPRDQKNWPAYRFVFKLKTAVNLSETDSSFASAVCFCLSGATLRENFPSQTVKHYSFRYNTRHCQQTDSRRGQIVFPATAAGSSFICNKAISVSNTWKNVRLWPCSVLDTYINEVQQAT